MILVSSVDKNYLIMWLLFSVFFCPVLCGAPLKDKIYWRSSFANDRFLQQYGLTKSECIRQCKLKPGCNSISYKTLISRCEINDINAITDRIENPGSVVSMRSDWEQDSSTICDPACSVGETCNTETNSCEIKECSPPPPIAYTTVKGNRRSVGSKVQYKCWTDQVTVFTSVCLDTGQWTPVPACPLVDCGPPPPVPLSSVIPGGSNFEGHSRQYQCDAGYAPDSSTDVSSMVVTCQASGEWTESDFQCIVSCGEPSPKANAHVLGTGTTVGSTRDYQCNDGYALSHISDSSTMTVTCQQSREWTLTNFQCVADCQEPSAITGVAISPGNTIYQSTRLLQCQSGYRAENTAVTTATITCQESGDWSTPDDAFQCLRECASAPASKPNAQMSTTNLPYVEGDTLTYQCLYGYIPGPGSDDGEVTCQSDGSWSISTLLCLINCGTPPTVSNSHWSGTTYDGSVVTYTCSDRYELSPSGVDSTVTCRASGSWTNVLFTCEIASHSMDCDSDADCLESNSRCVDNNHNGRRKCLCDHHTEYDEDTRSCTTRCTSYSSDDWIKIDNTYINKFNLVDYWYLDHNQCKQRCIDYGQECASVDYVRNRNICALNRVTYQQILDGDPSQLIHAYGTDIYTRNCSLE